MAMWLKLSKILSFIFVFLVFIFYLTLLPSAYMGGIEMIIGFLFNFAPLTFLTILYFLELKSSERFGNSRFQKILRRALFIYSIFYCLINLNYNNPYFTILIFLVSSSFYIARDDIRFFSPIARTFLLLFMSSMGLNILRHVREPSVVSRFSFNVSILDSFAIILAFYFILKSILEFVHYTGAFIEETILSLGRVHYKTVDSFPPLYDCLATRDYLIDNCSSFLCVCRIYVIFIPAIIKYYFYYYAHSGIQQVLSIFKK